VTHTAPALTTSHPATAVAYKATVGLLVFLGISALGGGLMMIFAGDTIFPAEWLTAFPVITNWVVPGLVLAIGFGVGSLVTAHGARRQPTWGVMRPVEQWTRQHWSWLATSLIGLGQMVWIALELLYLEGGAWLQVLYGSVGVALFLLPLTAELRRRLSIADAPEDTAYRTQR